jgi:hypothetical protein
MEIDTAVRGQRQHGWREQVTICHDHNNVWLECGQCLHNDGWPQTHWLQDGQVVLKSQGLDRGCCRLLTPAAWAIRLRDHGPDLMR